MKKIWLCALLAGCTDEATPDVIEPLVTADTQRLEFSMVGFSGDSFEYAIDVRAQAVSGFRVLELDDGTFCRARLPATADLTPASARALDAALAVTQLVTLGSAACAELESGCGGDFDGDFVGVRVDGGELYSQRPGCRRLRSQIDLGAALGAAFDSLAPLHEQVAWTGNSYEPTGAACTSAGQPLHVDPTALAADP